MLKLEAMSLRKLKNILLIKTHQTNPWRQLCQGAKGQAWWNATPRYDRFSRWRHIPEFRSWSLKCTRQVHGSCQKDCTRLSDSHTCLSYKWPLCMHTSQNLCGTFLELLAIVSTVALTQAWHVESVQNTMVSLNNWNCLSFVCSSVVRRWDKILLSEKIAQLNTFSNQALLWCNAFQTIPVHADAVKNSPKILSWIDPKRGETVVTSVSIDVTCQKESELFSSN